MKILWSPRAIDSAAKISRRMARDSPAAARQWLQRVFAKVSSLSRFPEQGRQVPETQRPDIREIILPPYRILYRVRPDHIAVLTVRHGRLEFSAREIR